MIGRNSPFERCSISAHKTRNLSGKLLLDQSILANQTLPLPERWGWKMEKGKYCIDWTTLPEESQICKELVRCNCKREKGCSGRCKCVKVSLKFTELCKCGGDWFLIFITIYTILVILFLDKRILDSKPYFYSGL